MATFIDAANDKDKFLSFYDEKSSFKNYQRNFYFILFTKNNSLIRFV